ncbi:hypothetical protein HQ586_07290 [Candidatus Bathyarchaeota archaeon]|nr:hypothetical protein [Candidatus Bathyarchaeota archaeon]
MKVARWAYLLEENPDFKRWYRNMALSSEGTASQRARILYRFLGKNGLTLDELTEMGKRNVREVEDLLMDFVSDEREAGRAPGYISNYLKTVRAWLKFNGILLVRTINTGNNNSTPTIAEERAPRPDEILQVMNTGTARSRSSIVFLALAGLRPMTLGNHNGSNGLEVRDLPELQLTGSNVHFSKIPTRIVVRAELSKTKMQYETFLPSEGCDCVKAYLEMRMANGEELHRESAIISVAPGYEKTSFRNSNVQRGKHVTTKTVTADIRNAIRPRFNWRPYVMRAYFATRLLVAESNGKMTHSYRQFHMGHAGDMLARYTVNKGRLPEELIEDMRRSFANSEEYLALRKIKTGDAELISTKTMVELGLINLDRPEIRNYLFEQLNIRDRENKIAKTREEYGLDHDQAEKKILLNEMGVDPYKMKVFKENDNAPKTNGINLNGTEKKMKNSTKVIQEEQVEEYLNDGWEIYQVLPSGSIVIKKFTIIDNSQIAKIFSR